jgi:hypothetical protein
MPKGVLGLGTPSAPGTLPVDGTCGVHENDHMLHCDNTPGVELHTNPRYASAVSGILQTSSSWFSCWQYGDHNDVWYRTRGNVTRNGFNGFGFIPASDVHTRANPAPNLRRCHVQESP